MPLNKLNTNVEIEHESEDQFEISTKVPTKRALPPLQSISNIRYARNTSGHHSVPVVNARKRTATIISEIAGDTNNQQPDKPSPLLRRNELWVICLYFLLIKDI